MQIQVSISNSLLSSLVEKISALETFYRLSLKYCGKSNNKQIVLLYHIIYIVYSAFLKEYR